MKKTFLFSILVTLIFALRWINCLPFSGYMPVLDNADSVAFFGRYLIYAQEPFAFPLGLIKNLHFPFQTASTRGSIPLIAVFFKLLGKIYPFFSQFYYFVFAEIVAVFLTGYFACLIFNYFKIKSPWIKLLGVIFTTLSPALLYRSSIYYQVSFTVFYFPVYLAFFYFYLQTIKKNNLKIFASFVLLYPLTVWIDNYLFLGVVFLGLALWFLNFIKFLILPKNSFNYFYKFSLALFSGLILSFFSSFILGNFENLEVASHISALDRRFSSDWGYGGGYGGGFHVADMLTFFIPPPNSLPARLGFPLTTNKLQPGEYEGFMYLGTMTLVAALFLIAISFFSIIRNLRISLIKFRLNAAANVFLNKNWLNKMNALGIASFFLFVLSWGYIFHLGGLRLNNIGTPALALALVWPKFLLVRSLGRLAAPLMLYVILLIIIKLDRYFVLKGKNKILILIVLILIVGHLIDIKDYLQPSPAVYGNEIALVFNKNDQNLVKSVLGHKKALMIIPRLRDNYHWDKICYALSYYSYLPLSGASFGAGYSFTHKQQYQLDIQSILSGDIKSLVGRYGEIAIASPPDIAKEILSKSNLKLRAYRLENKDVIIMTLERERDEAR